MIVTAMTTVLAVASFASVADAAIVTADIQGKAGVVVDLQTGQVIADKDGDERLPIASTTKLLTVYMVEKAIADGKLSLDTKVTISAAMAEFSQDLTVANTPMSADQSYTVQQLLEAALLPSSNSAALALGEKLAGSQSKFNDMLTKQLESWGIKGSRMYSASGLTNGDMGRFKDSSVSDDAQNKLSARELAIVARHLVQDYPDVVKITSMTEAKFPTLSGAEDTIYNLDTLLTNTGSSYKFSGLKTGTTNEDGGNFVGLTEIKGRKVITVVLNSGTSSSSDIQKFTDTLAITKQADDATVVKTIKKGASSSHKTVSVITASGKGGAVSVATNEATGMFVPTAEKAKVSLTFAKAKKSVKAPIKKGEVLATAKVTSSDKSANDFLDGSYTTDLVSTKAVKKTNWFVQTWRNLFSKSSFDIVTQ
jgi:D-alanyl-D-alanine carboxypeptidase (penicillin-binding protein 5/6)